MMMQRLQNYVWTSELVRAVVTNGNISETSFIFLLSYALFILFLSNTLYCLTHYLIHFSLTPLYLTTPGLCAYLILIRALVAPLLSVVFFNGDPLGDRAQDGMMLLVLALIFPLAMSSVGSASALVTFISFLFVSFLR
jgi:hypothetical protein